MGFFQIKALLYLPLALLLFIMGCGLSSSTITSLSGGSVAPIFLFPILSNFPTIVGNSSQTNMEFNGVILSAEKIDETAIQLNQWVSTTGLIAHWDLNETQFSNGTLVLDASGNSHTGTVNTDNGIANKFSSDPKIANAMDFDGVGDYITVPDAPTLSPTAQLTISAWVKVNPGGYAADNGIVCKGPTDWNQNSYILTVESGVGFSFRVLTSSGMGRLEAASEVVGKWVHIVGTYDGTTIKLYQDGVETRSMFHSGTIDVVADPLMIGKRCGADNSYFNGTLDDIAIFDRALSAIEVEALYDGQNPEYNYQTSPKLESPVFTNSPYVDSLAPTAWAPYGKSIIDTGSEVPNYSSGALDSIGLIAHYRLDEAGVTDGTVIADSRMSNDGQFVGTPGLIRSIIGRHLGGVSFNGVDEHIEINDAMAISPSVPSFSYGAWVYLESSGQGSGSRVLSKGNGGTSDDYALKINSANKVSCRITNDSATVITAESNYTLSLNTWYYLSCSYDGSQIRAYVNGYLVKETAQSGNIQQSSENLIVGSHLSSPAGRRLQGRVDDVTLWSRVLSAVEMRSIYERGAMNIKYRVRYCNSTDCSGEDFVGPDGSSASYFSEETNTSVNQADFDLSLLPVTRPYFQYQILYETIDSTLSPQISDVVLSSIP